MYSLHHKKNCVKANISLSVYPEVYHCKAALKQSILSKALCKWRWLELTFVFQKNSKLKIIKPA